jgi:hypothetical protein
MVSSVLVVEGIVAGNLAFVERPRRRPERLGPTVRACCGAMAGGAAPRLYLACERRIAPG